jgi:hypothetical protein
MGKIVLYDALSYLRVRLETETTGDFLRGVLNEAANPFDTRIWVWDGPGANAKRRAIFPPYKTKRVPKPGLIQQMDFIRELLTMTGVWQIRVPEFEGDDVVAALTKHFLATTDQAIHIQCRDADLTALCALSPRVTSAHAVKIPYDLIQLYKVCVGDGSDDIPGIKGFGQKTWDEADKAGLRKFVNDLITSRTPIDDDAHALAIGMSKATCTWLRSQESIDQLCAMKMVIDPLPVPQDLINQYLKREPRDAARMEAKMKEFML